MHFIKLLSWKLKSSFKCLWKNGVSESELQGHIKFRFPQNVVVKDL